MRTSAVVMLVVAVVLGGISAFAARHWIEQRVSDRPSGPVMATAPVVVASNALNFGDQIHSKHLSVVQWPASSVPPNVFSKIDDLLKGDRPRVALQRIEPNEVILKSKVSGFGGRATLSAALEENQRAVTIRVDDVTGVAGFLLPGDRVDVILTRDAGGRRGNPVNTLLLQDIRVLGVGQISNEQRDKPVVVRAVTVEASPKQSQKLVLAQQVGRLSLALRPASDRSISPVESVNVSDLTETDAPKRQVASAATSKSPAKRRVVRRSRPASDGLASIRVIRGLSIAPKKVPKEKAAEQSTSKKVTPPDENSTGSASGSENTSSIGPVDLTPSTPESSENAAESRAVP